MSVAQLMSVYVILNGFNRSYHDRYVYYFVEWQGHAKVIETLVRNGEDADECAYFGKTPLTLAAFEARVQAVDVLLRLGADPNVHSRSGGTCLCAAMMRMTPNNEVCILFYFSFNTAQKEKFDNVFSWNRRHHLCEFY